MRKQIKGTRTLTAKQIMAFIHPDGMGMGLMMIDHTGCIYVKTDEGWEPYDMREALHDSKV